MTGGFRDLEGALEGRTGRIFRVTSGEGYRATAALKGQCIFARLAPPPLPTTPTSLLRFFAFGFVLVPRCAALSRCLCGLELTRWSLEHPRSCATPAPCCCRCSSCPCCSNCQASSASPGGAMKARTSAVKTSSRYRGLNASTAAAIKAGLAAAALLLLREEGSPSMKSS